jgi:hypothetical protein
MRLVTPKDLPGRYSGVASDVISTFTTSTPCVGASGDGTITSRRTPARTVLAPACVCVMVVVVVGGCNAQCPPEGAAQHCMTK